MKYNFDFNIVIGGLPGAGSSTIARELAEELDYTHFDAGKVFKKIAKEKGMTMPEFEEYILDHPEMDIELDKKLEEMLKNDKKLVINSKVAALFAQKKDLNIKTIWLFADMKTRAERVMKREGFSLEKAQEYIEKRSEKEVKRYKKLYSIDLTDHTVYNIVIDTNARNPKEIVRDIILEMIN